MSIVLGVLMPHPPLIVPAVGKGEERKIQKTIDACREASRRIAAAKPDVIVVASPHAPMYQDYFAISGGSTAAGTFASFGAPSETTVVDYHEAFVKTLAKNAAVLNLSAGTLGGNNNRLDHGTMVPLSFMQDLVKRTPIVRVGLSGFGPLDHYRLGVAIQITAKERNLRTVFLASGDLSHKLTASGPYGFHPDGPKFDRMVVDALERSDFETLLALPEAFCEAAAECGLRSLQMMAGALDGQSVRGEILSHEGPFGVGYAVATVVPTGEDPSRRFADVLTKQKRDAIESTAATASPPVKLARNAIESWVKDRQRFDPSAFVAVIGDRRAGTFVSIHKDGRLRGCIGTISPTQDNLAQEIVANAIAACSRDPRFDAVTPSELPDLELSVDVLSVAEPCTKADLDCQRYGVIVKKGSKTGLLLPKLEGVDTVEAQLNIALSKAGIDPSLDYSILRFEVVRYH